MTTFCKADGPLEIGFLEGGPRGGNGEVDMEAFVGLVIADEPLLPPPCVELLRPELTDDGLEWDPEPAEPSGRCFAARVTCLDCTLGSFNSV